MLVIDGDVVGFEENGLTGEPGFDGVVRGVGAAFGGDRTGAVFRVLAVCIDLVFGSYRNALSCTISSRRVFWRPRKTAVSG